MGTKDRPVWSAGRRWLGNLLPLLVWLPPTAYGVVLALQGADPLGAPLAWVAGGQIAGWLGVALLGGTSNRAMREELGFRLARRFPAPPANGEFVGLSTAQHRSLADPHEDVGFLFLLSDRLEYVGEKYQMVLPRPSIHQVRGRRNVHTWLGLGGWIELSGIENGTPFRLWIEPRGSAIAFANRSRRSVLLARLKAWHEAGASLEPQSSE